jgi:hypothetical protein
VHSRALSRLQRTRIPRLAQRIGLVAVIAGCIALAGCGTPSDFPTVTATPSPAASALPSPAPNDLKPALAGLLDRNGVPPSSYLGALGGYVVNVYWKDLQPTSGGSLAPDNAIDRAITEVNALNAAHGTQLGLKIRVFAGIWAPTWVKDLGGSPITLVNPQGGGSGTIGRFWTDAFGSAYTQFEDLLAAKYDEVPAVREVTISRCTTFYDEPFIRDTTDPTDVTALLDAGYTPEADESCQRQEIATATVWQHTRSDLALNPYEVIGTAGTKATDEPFTLSMMQYCRQLLGLGCVLENNSLRYPVIGAGYEAMYESMSELGAPISFQTATADRVGDLSETIGYAVTLGANSVELPGGYQSIETPASFSASGKLLANNALASAPMPPEQSFTPIT